MRRDGCGDSLPRRTSVGAAILLQGFDARRIRHGVAKIERDPGGLQGQRRLQVGPQPRPGARAVPVIDEARHAPAAVAIRGGLRDVSREISHFAEQRVFRREVRAHGTADGTPPVR